MMKNVNLTGLYLALIANCDVTGFELSSVRKLASVEPSDVLIDFEPRDAAKVNIAEVEKIVKENITGDVKQVVVNLNDKKKIHVYIEFVNSDWNDNYAYKN
jgi:hypothetical protein